MRLWNYLLFLLISCCILTACHTSRTLTVEHSQYTPISFDKITPDSVYKRIENNQDLKFITAKGQLKFNNDHESVEGKITLYIIKDSLYLAIIKKLGIELSRILITKDSFKILDRINESYSLNAMDDLVHKYKIPIDFSSIHQLLTSGCFLDPDIYYEFKKDSRQCTLYGTSESETLIYQLDTFRLLPQAFEAKYENHDLYVGVQKSGNFSGKWIPLNLVLKVSNSKNETTNIQISWDEIKLDSISTIKFSIPTYYTKAGE